MIAKPCEVLIAGAGPAGCALALALNQAGVDALLLDRPLALPFRIGESASPDVAGLLAKLGVEHALLGQRPCHGNVSLWGGEQPQLDHFLFRAQGHGWHLDRAAFDRALQLEALGRGVAMLTCSGVDGIAPDSDGWQVQVRGMGAVKARVVVDAGGRRSPLASRLGVPRFQLDKLVALACHAPEAQALAGYSLVESCPYGWWYAAGLPDGRALVALMTDQDLARQDRLSDPPIYADAWRATRLLSERVPAIMPDAVRAFAAHSGCVQHAAGPGWLCVGDALMGLDPLTSSGISGALSDALAAVPAVLGMLDGDLAAARAYTQRADESFRRYLGERARHYGTEGRWPEQPFWARRLALSAIAA